MPLISVIIPTFFVMETRSAGTGSSRRRRVARSGAVGNRAVARSRLQPPAPALGHRHAEPRRLRGALLGSPRSGLTQVSTRPGQDQARSRSNHTPHLVAIVLVALALRL